MLFEEEGCAGGSMRLSATGFPSLRPSPVSKDVLLPSTLPELSGRLAHTPWVQGSRCDRGLRRFAGVLALVGRRLTQLDALR